MNQSQRRVDNRLRGPPPPPAGPPKPAADVVRREADDGAVTRYVALGGAAFGAILLLLVVLLVLLLGRHRPETGSGETVVAGTGAGQADNGSGAPPGGIVETTDAVPGGSSDSTPTEPAPSTDPSTEPPSAAPREKSTPPRTPPTKSKGRPRPPSSFGIRSLPAAQTNAPTPTSPTNGSLGDFQERLEREGAGSGDVQVSLLWNDYNDVDLHVRCPSGELIKFDHRTSRCGGELDVDMNADGAFSEKPVENVYWPSGGAPRGEYQVLVHFFAPHVSGRSDFEVAVKANGNTRKFRGTAVNGGPPTLVHRFRR